MNKRGATELSMNTIILAIIGIIVLLLVITFFTGGLSTVFGKIRGVFTGGTAGYDVDLARTQCEDFCRRAVDLDQGVDSTYCKYTFNNVDIDRDGKIGTNEKTVKCDKIPGVSCSITCPP